jgi:hypothetical protein
MTSLFAENANTEVGSNLGGIFWNSFGGSEQSLEKVAMWIRPKNFDSVSKWKSRLHGQQGRIVKKTNFFTESDAIDADKKTANDGYFSSYESTDFNAQYRHDNGNIILLIAINISTFPSCSYHCVEGMTYFDTGGIVQDEFSLSCGWNEMWLPASSITVPGSCVCELLSNSNPG